MKYLGFTGILLEGKAQYFVTRFESINGWQWGALICAS